MKKKNNIVNPVQLQELQQMVCLQEENDELEKDQLKLAKLAAEKKQQRKQLSLQPSHSHTVPPTMMMPLQKKMRQ
jgi:hypothetical protein